MALQALGLASMGISFIGGLMQSSRARRAAQDARRNQLNMERKISEFEQNRQDVINPYAGITSLANMIKNPFANLQVATRGAEMKAEEVDLSLANTLDTLRATGSGAGGATALAQAALRSKINIAANVEQQEAQNARMRAQGEFQADQLRMKEAMRIQGAQAQGKAFMFNAQERRDMQSLNRMSAMAGGYAQQAAGYSQQASAGMGQALGSLAGLGMSMYKMGGAGAGGSGMTEERKEYWKNEFAGMSDRAKNLGTITFPDWTPSFKIN